MDPKVFVCDIIHIKRNGGDGTVYPLTRQCELILGKDESCDLRVQLPSACDRHAKLRVDKSGKVFVSSLVAAVPVNLNGTDVLKETLVANKSVVSVGSCNFRFDYRDGFVTSPLQEENRVSVTPVAGKLRKSPSTPRSAASEDKENMASSPRRKSRTPHTTPAAAASSRPDTPTIGVNTPRPKKSITPSSAGTGTPVSAPSSKKKGRVDTPTVPRIRTRRSSCSSLYTISEELPTPHVSTKTTPLSTTISSMTPSSTVRVDSPLVASRRRPSRSRVSSMSTSLMSIQEEDELLAISPSPLPHKQSRHSLYSSVTGVSRRSVDPSKRAMRKSVSFGPALSPEVFNKRLPPSTPVKTGTNPGGLQRSLPANFAVPEAVTEEEVEEEETMEYSMTGFEEVSSSEEEATSEESEGEDETPVVSPAQQRTLTTPLKKAIHSKPSLQPRYRKLATPLRRAIQGRPRLRQTTRRSLPSPVRHAIHGQTALRKARRALNTPIRKQIEDMPTLRKTKRSLPTPFRQEIQDKVELRKTKPSLATPLKRTIEERPALRKTKKALATPLRKEIECKPTLRKTKRTMCTPLRLQIEARPTLRKMRRTLPTPIRSEIEKKPGLRKTKQSMLTPIRHGIESRPTLRKTKPTLPTPIREDIKRRPHLRKTKRTLPTPLRMAIQQRPVLRPTKKSLPADLLDEIASRPTLRATRKSMPTPLREEIQKGVKLHALSPRPATRSKRTYTDTVVACETPVPAPPAKRRKTVTTPQPLQPSPVKRSKRDYAKTAAEFETPVLAPPAKRRKTVTTPQPLQPSPVKRSKRDYAKTVAEFETPVPAPPAKRMRITNSPALSTPTAYNFDVFVAPGKTSPEVDISGLPRLFKSPRTCHSIDPADVFEVRLFGESREISFASPLAQSAKKSVSRPNSAEALHSCLKNTEPCLFTIGTENPLPQKRRQAKHTRNSSVPTSTCVTRSRAAKQRDILLTDSTMKRNSAAPSLPAVQRSTRSRAATTDSASLQPVMATRRSTRLTMRNMVTLQEELTHTTRPKRRMASSEDAAINTCTRSQKSKINEQGGHKTTQKRLTWQQVKEMASDLAKPSTRVTSKAKKPEPEAMQAKSEPAVSATLRYSRRLLLTSQQAKQQPAEVTKKVKQQTGTRRTRQAVKQPQGLAVEEDTSAVKPITRSSCPKQVTSPAVPMRRSSRLRK